MPKRSRIVTEKDYEPKRRNPITLGDDSNVDTNLKVIKVDTKNTILELSDSELKVRGAIDASAITVDGASVQTGTDAGATELNGLSDVTYSSGDLTIDSLDKLIVGAFSIDAGMDITIDAGGGQIWIANSGTIFGQFDTATSSKLKLIGTTDYQVSIHSQGSGDITLSSSDDILIDATDSLTLDSDGTYIMKKDGTEFSPANSAYAGMILGYTRIFNLSSTNGYNVITVNNSSMTVLQTAQGTDVKVQFIVPPSGNVEIECTFWSSFSSRGAKFSLSDSATYNEVAFNYTYDADYTIYNDETDHHMHRIVFGVSGLTAGTDTTYYLGGLASATFAYIMHGKNRIADSYYPPIIMKATALPATITTGE